MKLGEVVVDHLTEVSSIKVPLRSCYMVGEFGLSKYVLMKYEFEYSSSFSSF